MHLASVQRIKDITPIEGADAIETAHVLGWQVVVKKGEYKVGDLCCYVQIDTVMPDNPEYEFLRERKFRVRTIKLRKQISQGLIVPLPPGKHDEGDSLTKEIGVIKYEKPDNNPQRFVRPRMPKVWWKKWLYLFKYNVLYKLFPWLLPKERKPFPTHLVPITDEERIQNMPHVLETHRGKRFVLSYKLDGSSITIIHNRVMGKSKYRICSRRFELFGKNEWTNVFNATDFQKHIQSLIRHYDTDDIIVQGEAIGKFNGNYHKRSKDEIRLFNIYVNGQRINQLWFYDICSLYGIPCVPLYRTATMDFTLQEVLAMSDIPDLFNPDVPAEGLVWRCVDDNLSFKAISNKYLLEKGE